MFGYISLHEREERYSVEGKDKETINFDATGVKQNRLMHIRQFKPIEAGAASGRSSPRALRETAPAHPSRKRRRYITWTKIEDLKIWKERTHGRAVRVGPDSARGDVDKIQICELLVMRSGRRTYLVRARVVRRRAAHAVVVHHVVLELRQRRPRRRPRLVLADVHGGQGFRATQQPVVQPAEQLALDITVSVRKRARNYLECATKTTQTDTPHTDDGVLFFKRRSRASSPVAQTMNF
ncbi:hypothetical protein EVAR_69434_1 [Eumeta japonica]|uniref:Uncharacterized protein n=1 Tax=Eumeta variegata TaxID=151549 RepID=A0A4C2A968_EUMVA|nr:hypothetical protein EVAR_69434_1 [Eumeta japonica]